MDEDVRDSMFCYLVGAHVIPHVSMVVEPTAQTCTIRFLRGDGQAGNVVTKRGSLKRFRLGTAIGYLRECGLTSASIEFGAVEPHQASIPEAD